LLCARTGHGSLFHARGFNVSELHRPLLIMRVALIIQVKSYVMNYEWMQSRNIYDKKKVQSSENILTIVCLSRELYKIKDTRYYREISRRNETLRAFPSTLFKSCSTWRRCLPELGSQDAARPVRSFVWPSCIVQLNLKPEAPLSALLPTNNEIERDSWEDVSTIELRGVLSTGKIKNIHFSAAENVRIETSRSVQTVFRTAFLYYSLPSYII